MKYYIPSLLWAVLILFLSAGPGIQLAPRLSDILGIDKLGHFLFYGVFAILVLWGLLKNNPASFNLHSIIKGVSICILYGIALEIMQFTLFPNRYFEFLDIIANIIGSLAGVVFFKRIFKT